MRVEALLDRLRRKTSSGRFIPEVDGLRFIAVTLVVLFHLSGKMARQLGASDLQDDWLARLTAHGHYGVELFFVISGFVLALPFALHHLAQGPPVSLKAYFLRRVTRLEPPYIICLTGVFIFLPLLSRTEEASALFPHYGAGVLYLHNWIYGFSNSLNRVAWSLEVEVQFYLMAPLLAGIFAVRGARRRRLAILGAVLGAMLSQAAFLEGARAAISLLNFIQYFLIGFLLADIYVTDWRAADGHRAWDWVALAGWPLLFVLWESPAAARAALPFAALLLFAAAFRGRLIRAVICNRWITTIGGMCYTIYLLHFLLITLLLRWTAPLSVFGPFWANLLLQSSLILPCLLAVSTAFFVLVERPCMEKNWPVRPARRLAMALHSLRPKNHLFPSSAARFESH